MVAVVVAEAEAEATPAHLEVRCWDRVLLVLSEQEVACLAVAEEVAEALVASAEAPLAVVVPAAVGSLKKKENRF